MKSKFIHLILFLGLILSVTSCSNKKNDLPPPNIVWLNCEDISPNLGCYGDEFATTPNLDKLANEGYLFENAYSTAPICAPSRSCLITGLYATSLGTQHLRSDVPRPDFIKTFPEILKENGYYVTNYAKTDYNFSADGIFDFWDQDLAPWRHREENKPFFSYFVFGMTHEGSVNHTSQWQKNTKDLPKELFHDSTKVPLPPYYPDTPEIRSCWTHYYDNNTVMDRKMGEILANLEEDGLKENTIVFFFSDHGAGFPRYKRWLYKTGIHIPFIVYIPDQYLHLVNKEPGSKMNNLVSFVDFAPTVLSMAGIEIPETMEGFPFMGEEIAPEREYVYGARSRADNMYETGRCILDNKYIYIRNYTPHWPYIQPGFIFSDVKESLKELRKLKNEGKLSAESMKMWQEKAPEELYDLENDPNELNNLIDSPEHKEVVARLRGKMHDWMIKHHDTGLLMEAEYMIRADGSTVYEMAHDPSQYPVEDVLEAAEMVGKASEEELIGKTKAKDSGERYWAVIGLQTLKTTSSEAMNALKSLLNDESPSVQIAAAEVLCHNNILEPSLDVLGKWVDDDRVWVALQAARSIELIEEKAKPLVPVLYKVLEKNRNPDPKAARRFKDFNFAAFTTWSVEWALHYCGEDIDITR